ncbi:hypothetical protein L1049_019324 [Liquidambar formosana]|uniref:ATP-dependent Clp protease proteolytic subunit n=1 Tax=Liquidambar formosana TaxID=63359 RepID=A0AAP0S5L6_LIQFO
MTPFYRSSLQWLRPLQKRYSIGLPIPIPLPILTSSTLPSSWPPLPKWKDLFRTMSIGRGGLHPDLPSLLLHGRIVYIGMPLVPAVTELVVAELMYLQWMDPKEPIYIYINSTGTTRDDGETVGMESEGFAIYDAMMQLKNEIHTVAVGAAIGQACLLLASGTKGKRFMMPHSKVMVQQPRVPSSGLMPASDVLIRAKEAITNRDTLVKLLAKHTGNEVETVYNVIKRPFYMDSARAKEFGVVDKVLWRGQEKIMADAAPPEEWDKSAGIKVVDGI